MVLVVADDVFLRVAYVDGWFENLHFLSCELGASQTADKLLGLTREHRAADDFYAAWAVLFSVDVVIHIGCKNTKKSEK